MPIPNPAKRIRAFIKLLLTVNFSASVIFLFLVSAVSLFGQPVLFEDGSDLYGPMASNLRLMLLYLCLTELAVCSFCRFSDQYQGVLLMGLFLLLLAVSVDFYGEINDVPIDENYARFFIYLGVSHVAYAVIFETKRKRLG